MYLIANTKSFLNLFTTIKDNYSSDTKILIKYITSQTLVNFEVN